MKNTKNIAYLSMFIAMEVILSRFLSIQTPIVKFGFSFLPIAAASIMFGGILGGAAAAIADVLGAVMFPIGAYFPGFTVSAFLGGTLYGIIMHKKKSSILRTIAAVAIITIIVDLVLNTYWLTLITGKAASILIIPRVIRSAIMFPVQSALIYSLWNILEKVYHTDNAVRYHEKSKIKCN